MTRPRLLDLFCGAGGAAMGIDWTSRDELDQAIPPAYTEYIGGQLLEQIPEPRAAAQGTLL